MKGGQQHTNNLTYEQYQQTDRHISQRNKKIKTTQAKAKEVSGFTEKLITKAKKGDLASRRFLLKFFSKDIVKKMIDEIAPQYKDRKGGYTRIIKLGPRKSDGAKMAIIELVE